MGKDLFSHDSEGYSRYRPSYPKPMIKSIIDIASGHDLAIDVGAGNGQATKKIFTHFKKVIATDHSQSQLENMNHYHNVQKIHAPAEKIPSLDNSADLITCAQALHWFKHEQFYTEAERCLKPNGILATWGYNLMISKHKIINEVVQSYYNNIIGTYWPPERKLLEKEYDTIQPSNLQLVGKSFYRMKYIWTPDHLEGYLNTWSSTQAFIKDQNYNPVNELMAILRRKYVGKFGIEFPIFLWLWKKG